MIYYDGRQIDKVQELAEIAILKGLIPRFKADLTPDPKGRTFMLEHEGEKLLAKKRDEVYTELQKCPKIQDYLLELIKNGAEPINYEDEVDEFDGMSEDEFENTLFNETSDGSEAEETESNWENI